MQVTIDLPDHLQLTEADLRQELAIARFQQERITFGSASQLVGVHQIEFQRLIVDRGINSLRCIRTQAKPQKPARSQRIGMCKGMEAAIS